MIIAVLFLGKKNRKTHKKFNASFIGQKNRKKLQLWNKYAQKIASVEKNLI